MCQFQIHPRQTHARWRTTRENERGRGKRRGRHEAARRRFLEGVRQACAALRGRWVRRQLLVTPGQVVVLHTGFPPPLVLGKINIVLGFESRRPPWEVSAGNSRHLRAYRGSGVNQSRTQNTHCVSRISMYPTITVINYVNYHLFKSIAYSLSLLALCLCNGLGST